MTPHDATAVPLPPHLPPLVRPRAPQQPLRMPAGPTPTGQGSGGPATAVGACLAVAAGRDGVIRVVDPADPRGGRLLGRHGSQVTALVACGGLLYSAGCDGRVLGWTLGAPSALSVVVGFHRAGVTSAAMAGDGRLVTAGHDGEVRAWRDAASEVLAVHPGGVETFALFGAAPMGAGTVVTAGRDGRLRSHPDGDVLELRRRRRELTLAALPLGPELVTATGHRGTVRLWGDLRDGSQPEEVGVHGTWVLALVAPDADSVAAVGGDHVTLWDLRTGDARRTALDDGLHATAAVALADDGLALVAPDGRVQVTGRQAWRP